MSVLNAVEWKRDDLKLLTDFMRERDRLFVHGSRLTWAEDIIFAADAMLSFVFLRESQHGDGRVPVLLYVYAIAALRKAWRNGGLTQDVINQFTTRCSGYPRIDRGYCEAAGNSESQTFTADEDSERYPSDRSDNSDDVPDVEMGQNLSSTYSSKQHWTFKPCGIEDTGAHISNSMLRPVKPSRAPAKHHYTPGGIDINTGININSGMITNAGRPVAIPNSSHLKVSVRTEIDIVAAMGHALENKRPVKIGSPPDMHIMRMRARARPGESDYEG
ncbi:hypothetical protein F4804DRAFT_337313 [Jackrogersella minutella]|nr:hypothetical protein F4804DRAFT_337313 [Jackrogersella minutella]